MPNLEVMGERIKKSLVVLDADDTLWNLEELYDQARSDARSIVEAVGLDGAAWEQSERTIDVDNVAAFGMSPLRFPTSCVQAYDKLARSEGLIADNTIALRIRNAAEEVFRMQPTPINGVKEALDELAAVSVLVLLSKGVPAIQMSRLNASGLASYFNHVSIVDSKDTSSFEQILKSYSVLPVRAWSIGNSLSSDIVPALEIGMFGVWVDAHVWEYERRTTNVPPTNRFFSCLTINDAAQIVVSRVDNYDRPHALSKSRKSPPSSPSDCEGLG